MKEVPSWVEKIIKIFFIFFFFFTNLFIVLFLFLSSGNLAWELFKWCQLIAVILFSLYLLKKINKIIAFLTSLIIHLSFLGLITYNFFTQDKLNFSYLQRNFRDINSILPYFIYPLIVISIIALVNSISLYKLQSIIKNKFIYLALLAMIVLPQILPYSPKHDNELFAFIKTIYNQDKIIEYYQTIYSQLIKESAENKNNLILQAKKINNNQLPKHLDNIIILQLESLNGLLVNEKNTPNFIKIAKNGILFPKFYSNGVETSMGLENLLCSIPTSFDSSLVVKNLDKKITCLPEILKHLNYKTFFLKSYKLSFAKIGKFMENLQIDEIHADDIMQKNDTQYLWGYKEDIFFQRAFNYFKKEKKEKRNFLYIQIGPTNHWPFSTPKNLKNAVPFKNPKNHQQKFINTIFLQDKYLKIAWEEINNIFPEKNYTLFIVSDHGWPAEFHKKNTFNKKESFEENFITSMIMVIGNERNYKNKIITTAYSHLDLMPSILELFGINYPNNKFSRSFIKEIKGDGVNQANIILIQPFADRYINIIVNTLKYQYNSLKRNIILYDLKKDLNENNGQIISNTLENNLQIIKNLLN